MSKIMIAEREPGTRRSLEKLLRAAHFEVESVADGYAALERLETVEPDVILLDIAMPTLDGKQVIERLRQRRDDIPVVMLAFKGAAIDEALEQGATDYIQKPVDKKDLVVRVRRALAQRVGPVALEVPLRELHDPATGRIDAKKVAEFLAVPLAQLAEALNANYPTVYKTPAAPNLQEGLRPIKRSMDLISRVTRTPDDARAWLNNPHPDIGGRTPLAVILSGRADAVVTLLENALAGIPS